MSGKFIVIEGLDGSGKTTQAKRLAEKLGAVLTGEPSDGKTGLLIREILRTGGAVNSRSLAALFAADRAEHVQNAVLPALAGGKTVVCDRFYLSNMAYQGGEMPIEDVLEINRRVLPQGLQPDITIFIDVTPEEGLRRVNADETRTGCDFYEEIGRLEKTRGNYLRAIEILSNTEKIVTIDGNGSEEDAFSAISAALKEYGL